MGFDKETNGRRGSFNTSNNDGNSDADGTKASKNKDENNRRETDIETDIYNRPSTPPPKEKKQVKVKRKKPTPSNIPYDSSESSEKNSSGDESYPDSCRRVKKRPPIRDLDSESSESKRPRSESSESRAIRSESPKSSSTEEEIQITESQVVVTNKKSIAKDLNKPLNEVPNDSPKSEFFSLEDRNEDLGKRDNDVNVEDENTMKVNTEKVVEKQKQIKKKKHCTTICNLIDLVHSKNHPLRKYSQLFTHNTLSQLSKKELRTMILAAQALSQKHKK